MKKKDVPRLVLTAKGKRVLEKIRAEERARTGMTRSEQKWYSEYRIAMLQVGLKPTLNERTWLKRFRKQHPPLE